MIPWFLKIGEIDARDNIVDATIVDESTTKESNSTDVAIAEKSGNKKSSKKSGSAAYKKDINKLTKEIEKQSTELLNLELEFIRAGKFNNEFILLNFILLFIGFLPFTHQ